MPWVNLVRGDLCQGNMGKNIISLFIGRWKNNLIGKIARAGVAFDNPGISPVVRQTLQHWGYRLTEKDYQQGKKRVKM